ncbi:hypothetical protein [Rhodospirillaceae bacterium SYSU D60014]|uniref:hypothetical protein n=1 Tax=Virgifigura deserti TaxID=2268457 RepID=UPI0013C499D1
MISDIDIWRAAQAMVKQYGADASVQAVMRADQLLDAGDVEGQATWKRILQAIRQLQAENAPPGTVAN